MNITRSKISHHTLVKTYHRIARRTKCSAYYSRFAVSHKIHQHFLLFEYYRSYWTWPLWWLRGTSTQKYILILIPTDQKQNTTNTPHCVSWSRPPHKAICYDVMRIKCFKPNTVNIYMHGLELMLCTARGQYNIIIKISLIGGFSSAFVVHTILWWAQARRKSAILCILLAST